MNKKAVSTSIPTFDPKDPGLLTLKEFLKMRNKAGKYHDSESYQYTLKDLNQDFGAVFKEKVYVLNSTYLSLWGYLYEASNGHYYVKDSEDQSKIVATVDHDHVARVQDKKYLRLHFPDYVGVKEVKLVKYLDAESINDSGSRNRKKYKNLISRVKSKGEFFEIRSEKPLEKYKGSTIVILNEEGQEVGFASDEWGCTLITVAKEYRGFDLGRILGNVWYKYNPDHPSGGFTSRGEHNAKKIWRDRVREFSSRGWYSELVKRGEFTKERVLAILKNAKDFPIKPIDNESIKENKEPDLRVWSAHSSVILYDKEFLQDRDPKHILGWAMLGSSEHVGDYLYAIDYEKKYARLMTLLALQLAKDEGAKVLWVGDTYADLLELDKVEDKIKKIDKEHIEIPHDIVDLKKMARVEKALRKPFDKYREIEMALQEEASVKWR
jgi:hypothetical protein